MKTIITKIKSFFKNFNALKLSMIILLSSIYTLPQMSRHWGGTALQVFIICVIISALLYIGYFIVYFIKNPIKIDPETVRKKRIK